MNRNSKATVKNLCIKGKLVFFKFSSMKDYCSHVSKISCANFIVGNLFGIFVLLLYFFNFAKLLIVCFIRKGPSIKDVRSQGEGGFVQCG